MSYYVCIAVYFSLHFCLCLLYIFRFSDVGYISIYNCIFLMNRSFYLYTMYFLSLVSVFDLKYILSDISIATPTIFWLSFAWNIFLPSLHLELTGIPHFITLCFIVLHRYGVFYKLKVCHNPESSKSTGVILPIAFAHYMSLCHILIILTIPNFSIIFLMVSVIFDVTIAKKLAEGSYGSIF